MTRALQVCVIKEVRGLSLPLLASLATIGAAAVGPEMFRSIGVAAYFLGTGALGGLSIGHEYSCRTLSAVLAQPVRRQRLLLVKLAVLAGMLLVLSASAGAVLFDFEGAVRHIGARRQAESPWVFALPALSGLFFAPAFTMACRSPIAGAVFATVPPGALAVTGRLLGGTIYGFGTPQVDRFQIAFLWWTVPIACAAAAVLTWRMFMRLEAIDGRGPEVRLPLWLRPPAAESAPAPALTRRHPAWQLVKKELRLHAMPLAIAAGWTLGWLVTVSLRSVYPELLDVFRVLSIFLSGSLALLIGALASAEERHLGTLEWQTLLPVSKSAQWAIKAGTAIGLAWVLAIGWPALLVSLLPSGEIAILAQQFLRPQMVLSITLLTIAGLYVSSLSTSGLRALLLSLPALVGVALFFRFVVASVGGTLPEVLARLMGLPVPLDSPALRVDLRVANGLAPALVAALLLLTLQFALANHRSADRGAGRVWTQALWMAGGLTLAITLVAAVS